MRLLLIVLLLFLFLNPPNTYASTLANPSFEDIDMSIWRANSSNVTVIRDTSNAIDGTYSAKITNTSSSSYGVEQIVYDIQPEETYQIQSNILTSIPVPAKVFLRIAWYSSTDGSGSQISTEDSEIITQAALWQELVLIAQAPSTARSAKIRLLLANGTAWFDDIRLNTYLQPTEEPEPTFTPIPTLTIQPSPTSVPQSYNNIFLSEVMVYPETGAKEWIELFNNNTFAVELVNWSIDDAVSGGVAKKFTLTIRPQSYVVIELNTSLFNNTGDSVRLLDNGSNLKDDFKYTNSEKNITWGRTNWTQTTFCKQIPSKNVANTGCLVDKAIPTNKVTPARLSTQSAVLGLNSPTQTVTNLDKYMNYTYQTPATTSTSLSAETLSSGTKPITHNQNTLPLGITLSGSYAALSFVSFITKIAVDLSKTAVQ